MAVIYKPFFVYIISLISLKDGNLVATIQIIVTISLLLTTFDSGKQFYLNKQLNNYKVRLLLLFLIGLVFIGLYSYVNNNSIELIIVFIISYLFEKSYDEVSRFYLVNEKYNKWSKIIISKLILSYIILIFFLFQY